MATLQQRQSSGTMQGLTEPIQRNCSAMSASPSMRCPILCNQRRAKNFGGQRGRVARAWSRKGIEVPHKRLPDFGLQGGSNPPGPLHLTTRLKQERTKGHAAITLIRIRTNGKMPAFAPRCHYFHYFYHGQPLGRPFSTHCYLLGIATIES